MGSKKPGTLYHYCSLSSFVNIVKNSSIWLSDVQKSNDFRELAWFRQQYYEFILNKYNGSDDETVQSICEIILSIAAHDGFDKCPYWLSTVMREESKKVREVLFSLRTYAFCLSELKDSLGQWRGYANDGQGVAIGFSREYLDAVSGYSLRCPKNNFLLGDISYRKNFNSLFDKMFELHDKFKQEDFLMKSFLDLTHTAAMFKHPSFKEEKEWRIIYSMDDCGITREDLLFEGFNKIASDEYHNRFEIPSIDYVTDASKIIPHVEIKIKDLRQAINSIVIGPKCCATESDIRHLLLKLGALRTFDDTSIKIIHSESSYR